MSPRYISMLALILMLLSIVSYLPIAIGETTAKYKWTIMVYVDGDNNLEGAGIDDINEMELAGSTNEVAIIVYLIGVQAMIHLMVIGLALEFTRY